MCIRDRSFACANTSERKLQSFARKEVVIRLDARVDDLHVAHAVLTQIRGERRHAQIRLREMPLRRKDQADLHFVISSGSRTVSRRSMGGCLSLIHISEPTRLL